MNPKLVFIGIVSFVLLLILIVLAPYKQIDAGERGVVLKFGKVDRILSEGIHWKTPLIESVRVLDVKKQKIEVDADAASKDLQSVSTTIALNFHLQEDSVGELWQMIGSEYKVKVIDPAIQESVKASTALFTAEELITKRALVKDKLREEMLTRLNDSYIIVDDVSIVNFEFSESFDQAIEAKVTAEQRALESQNKLKQVEFEAQQKIETAKAEAEAIRIQAQAITQQGGKDYVQLKAIEKWNGNLPTHFVPGSSIPFINLSN